MAYDLTELYIVCLFLQGLDTVSLSFSNYDQNCVFFMLMHCFSNKFTLIYLLVFLLFHQNSYSDKGEQDILVTMALNPFPNIPGFYGSGKTGF